MAVRLFDEKTKKVAYNKQAQAVKGKNKSNCLDADHVAAGSKGGATSANSCEMLCINHNRAKGNR